MIITKHFKYYEFSQPARHGQEYISYPLEWVEDRLVPLCIILEAVRASLDHPIEILSGYRSPLYNKAVGGKKNSQHMQGRAADFRIKGLEPSQIYHRIMDMHRAKVIRVGGIGLYKGFVHLDTRDGTRIAQWAGDRTAAKTMGLGPARAE